MDKFGGSLLELRAKAKRDDGKEGMTRKQLSEKLQISTAIIAAYESGTKKPSLEYAVKIAAYFGVSLDSMTGASQNKISSCGDIARILTKLLEIEGFCVDRMRTDTRVRPDTEWHTGIYCENSHLENFLISYKQAHGLPNIFDTWLKGELARLDEISYEGEEDNDGET